LTTYTFEVGQQTLNDMQTDSHIRFSDAIHSDWDRIARQNLILQALYKKLENPATLPKIPGFFTQLSDSIVTDISAENVTDLTCVLQSVSEENIVQQKVRPEMVVSGPESLS
jgi:anionic cell wall polymer biosynthesis LytR-Cps2A-Psr (LCP) family protein